MELADIAQWVKILESLFKVIAIVVAGFWTWKLFIKHRRKFPRASVGHKVEFRELEADRDFLRLSLSIKNTGEVLLEIASGTAWAQQVLPLKEGKLPKRVENRPAELEWPIIGDSEELDLGNNLIEIEPGESETWHFDFLIGKDLKTVQLYSYVKNLMKGHKEIGWAQTSIHDLDKNKGTWQNGKNLEE